MSNNVRIVQQLYSNFAHSEIDAARKLLADDVQWLQCKGFPGGGHHRGADAVMALVFGGLRSQWQEFYATVDEYIEAEQNVIALGSYSGRHAVTGKSMTAVFAHVFDIRDGRIVRFRQYADTAPMVRAMEIED